LVMMEEPRIGTRLIRRFVSKWTVWVAVFELRRITSLSQFWMRSPCFSKKLKKITIFDNANWWIEYEIIVSPLNGPFSFRFSGFKFMLNNRIIDAMCHWKCRIAEIIAFSIKKCTCRWLSTCKFLDNK
jgi:hypothetical protein